MALQNHMRPILMLYLILVTAEAFGQEISGRIIDPEHHTLPGVAVIGLPDSAFATSDENGRFSIRPSEKLVFKLLGYEDLILVPGEHSLTNVVLVPDPILLGGIEVNDLGISTPMEYYPGSINYVPSLVIQASNPASITKTLNIIPGIYMHSGALNTNRITIRGVGSRSPFSTNKIRAYYEDIPLTNGSGETTIEDTDLFAIGALEIIKGPNSSIYGSGLGGVINIKERREDLFTTRLQSDFTVGSYGLHKESLGFSNRKENLNLSFIISNMHSDGYRKNNEFDRQFVFGSGTIRKEKDRFKFIAYLINQKAFIPSSIDRDTYNTAPRSAAFTWGSARGFEDYYTYQTGWSWDHNFNKKWILRSSVFHSMKDNYEARPFNILEDRTISFGTRNRVIMDAGGSLTLMFGLEIFGDRYRHKTFENLYQDFVGQGSVQGEQLSNLVEDRFYANFFSQVDYRMTSKLSFSIGVNLNSTSYDLTDRYNPDSISQTGHYQFNPAFSPRLGISYLLSGHTIAYATISSGFSPPSLEETLAPDGVINPDIKPETGSNVETGLRGRFRNSRYNLSLYSMNIRNLLLSRRLSDGQFIGINAGSSRHNGIELSIHSRLLDLEKFRLNHSFTYSHSNFTFKEFTDDDGDYAGNDLTGVPRNILYTSLEAKLRNMVYARISYQFTDKIPITDDNSVFSDEYQLVDASIGVEKTLKEKLKFDFSINSYNLFDEKYASMLFINAVGFGGNQPRFYYPGLPRNYQVRLRLTYTMKSH